ncbi:MAG TPA: sigma-70 family RNA polymerase sigma factor [bacterium]|nr:sigma-70 family RNA polymerase sigma factor [bacterium]
MEAWQELVGRYSGIVQAVIRRHLRSRDEDDLLAIYVDVLVGLHGGRLATFEGRSSLTSWLALIARNHTMDHLRALYGRREIPKGVRELGDVDREVYRLFHEEGHGFRAIKHQLAGNGRRMSTDDLLESLRRIDGALDGRVLKRCAYDRWAREVGGAPSRLLRLLDQLDMETEESRQVGSPEAILLAKEARERLARIGRLIDRLPAEDRRVIELRFEQERTVPEIVARMDLPDRRKAYTILARAIRRVRRMMGGAPEAGAGLGRGSE